MRRSRRLALMIQRTDLVVDDALGYQVKLHASGVTGRDSAEPMGANGNHLVVTVHGLHSADAPEGEWLVDVGLGDALYEPLPLRPGRYRQGAFVYQLSHSEAVPSGWRFDHDSAGCLGRMDFAPRPAVTADFVAMHQQLTTDPQSHFVRTITAQRRDEAGMYLLRGCVLDTVTGEDTVKEVGTTPRRPGSTCSTAGSVCASPKWTARGGHGCGRRSAPHQRWLSESASTRWTTAPVHPCQP